MTVPATLAEALARFEPVIGLEVHAQLETRSKLFSPAANTYDPDHPNRWITAYCFGLPGVLPVPNRGAVELAVKAALALGCAVQPVSTWSRKQYFYPDLPKGYQISQYDEPFARDGHLAIDTAAGPKRVHITRIHMEEDAGKTIHVEGAPYSLVDYNRAGVPLVEIVSGPDLGSAEEASAYLKALRSILVTLGVCSGNMERGAFRCDANVSIRPRGSTTLGTRCEIKNVNSFRFVEQAIEHEILRQAIALSEGRAIEQETRLYDSQRRETRSMRSKEEAHDYRYFPDPDLPPLVLAPEWVEALRTALPELPAAKLARWLELGVPEEHARTFAEEPAVAAYFDAAVRARPSLAQKIANAVKGEILRELKDDPEAIRAAKLSPADLAELLHLEETDAISSTQRKKMLTQIWREGTPLAELVAEQGTQVTDVGVLETLVVEALTRHPSEAEQYRRGKKQVLGFLVGQVMKASGGKAKPPLVKELLVSKLEES